MRYEIVRYFFKLSDVYELITARGFETVTFFIDVASISYGIYSSRVIKNNFFLNNEDVWFDEIVNYTSWLNEKFKRYEPFFILFFDGGAYSYHLNIYSEYKQNRSEIGYLTVDKTFTVDLKNGIQFLKKLTYKKLLELNKSENIISVYLDREESDIVPHFFIKHNFLETLDEKNLNIILSADKDLFQTTKFKNTIQIINSKANGKFVSKIVNRDNSLQIMIKKEIPDNLKNFFNSEWISYFLAVGGDKSDNIPSVPKIGYKTFFNLLIKNEIFEPNWEKIFEIEKLNKYREQILRNFKLVDFETISAALHDYLTAKIKPLV